jgi:hypothetical protein
MIKLLISLLLFVFPQVSNVKTYKPVLQQNKKIIQPLKQYTINEDWKAEIARYICTKDWDCETAVAIAIAESGLNPSAKSPTNDHGVMQLNGKKIYDVIANIDEAYRMYERRGFQPWAVYNSGKYKKYINWTISGATLPAINISENGY